MEERMLPPHERHVEGNMAMENAKLTKPCCTQSKNFRD